MPETTVAPALTPEEWAAQSKRVQKTRWGSELFAEVEPNDGDSLVVGYQAADETGDREVTEGWGTFPSGSPERHALAALALHGQPFGFTPEEAAAVLDAAGHVGHNCGDAGCFDKDAPEQEARLRSAAAKIAALLPQS